jgi:hypothetical protein
MKRKDNHESSKKDENTKKEFRGLQKTSCLRGKVSIDQIVNDFSERVMQGEHITIDDVLNKYPKLKAKLKPKLEIEMMLINAGKTWRVEFEKLAEKHKQELWQKLEKKIIDKQLNQIQERVALAKSKESVPVKLRAEFIPMLLYVKGRTARIGEGIRGITRFIKLLFLLDKETDLGKLVKVFYEFVPYKIGPFEPAVYQDLQVLEIAGIVKKQTYTYAIPFGDKEIDEGFNGNNQATIYTLTDEGMKYAKALISWLDKKDQEIALQMRKYKTYYAQASLKKLLEYIYKKYPEFTKESEIIKDIIK